MRHTAALLLALTLPAAAQESHDVTTYGVVWQVPAMRTAVVRAGLVFDGALRAHLTYPSEPAGKSWPAVVFVNGVGGALPTWEIYKDWAKLVAAHGMVGVLFEAEGGKAAQNLRSLMTWLLREGPKLSIDTSRVGLWACSANVTTALPYLMADAPPAVKAAAIYYGSGAAPKLRQDLPVYYVLAGRDGPGLNEQIRALYARAVRETAPWTMITAPRLTHAFDALDQGAESVRVVRETVAFLSDHLAPAKPDPKPSAARLALTHVYGNEPSEAAAVYAEIVRSAPEDRAALRQLGTMLVRAGRSGEALPHLKRAIELGDDNPGLLVSLGQTEAAAGDMKSAMASFRRAAEKGFPARRIWGGIALTQLQSGRPKEAAELYEQAFAIGIPEGADAAGIAYYNLACAYALSGRKAEALDRLAKAVAAGFGTRGEIESDADLATLRGEARFAEILAKARS